jgi:hypothetical protein
MIARPRPSTWAPTSLISGELSIRAGLLNFKNKKPKELLWVLN